MFPVSTKTAGNFSCALEKLRSGGIIAKTINAIIEMAARPAKLAKLLRIRLHTGLITKAFYHCESLLSIIGNLQNQASRRASAHNGLWGRDCKFEDLRFQKRSG